LSDDDWVRHMHRLQFRKVLFAIERSPDRYWCEVHDRGSSRVDVHLIRNGESIRHASFTARDEALVWVSAHDSLARPFRAAADHE
jgi:hypothetical protein